MGQWAQTLVKYDTCNQVHIANIVNTCTMSSVLRSPGSHHRKYCTSRHKDKGKLVRRPDFLTQIGKLIMCRLAEQMSNNNTCAEICRHVLTMQFTQHYCHGNKAHCAVLNTHAPMGYLLSGAMDEPD